MTIHSEFVPLNIVIFHSYVSHYQSVTYQNLPSVDFPTSHGADFPPAKTSPHRERASSHPHVARAWKYDHNDNEWPVFRETAVSDGMWSKFFDTNPIIWLVVSPPSEKEESQLGVLFPIYGKTKKNPNHQPVIHIKILPLITSNN